MKCLRATCIISDGMRILFFTGIFPNRVNPRRGIYILKQAVALKRRADVRVIAPVPYSPGLVGLRRYSHLSRIPQKDTIDGVDVTYARYFIIPKLLRFHHGVFLAWSVLGAFRRVTREFQPDVVVSYFAYPYGYAAVRLSKSAGLPVAVGVLGSDVNLVARSGLERRMVRECLASSEKVLSVSQALKLAAVGIGVPPEKIVVIPNGIDAERFVRVDRIRARELLDLPVAKRIVLCVANLVRVKGVDLVIRAFGELGDLDALLLIVGDGDQGADLRRFVRESGLEERVRFAGAKAPSEVPVWMAACDLVVLGSRAEGHPNVIVEAMASGRPVVATRVGGVPETVTSENLGLVVEAGNPAALAGAIRSALSRSWDEEAIRSVGLHRTWDDVADDIMLELEPLVSARRFVRRDGG